MPIRDPASDDVRELAAHAHRTRAGRTWDPAAPLSHARNAHATNTPEGMREALDGDFNWLEGDLASEAGRLVMAHPGDDPGLAFDEWLAIAARSERGIKVDLKRSAWSELPQVLEALQASGIPAGRLIVNVGDLEVDQLRAIRQALPDARISLNPEAPSGSYTADALDDVVTKARAIGGPVVFALRWDAATDEVLERLSSHGSISIWSSPWYATPEHAELETQTLRLRGVDGVIDLAEPASAGQRWAQAARRGFSMVTGQDPYSLGQRLLDQAREAAGTLLHMGGSASRDDELAAGSVAAELADVAERTRGGRRWAPDAPLSDGRNAHHTNTPQQMREALEHHDRYNWLEGDLRVDDEGTLVMAHDASQEGDGLSFDEWLAIGRAGERGMKVDVKELEALPDVLDALERSGIPDGRLMINVPDVSEQQARELRRRFPDAWLAFNPAIGSGGYTEGDLEAAIEDARSAGGNVTFPLRWDIATDDVIRRLAPHGRISIWTAVSNGTPEDAEGEAERLRERGVDGVIDLGPSSSIAERVVQSFNNGLEIVFGDRPGDGARRLARESIDDWRDPRMWPLLPFSPIVAPGIFAFRHGADVVRGAITVADGLASTATDGLGDALGSARDLAARAPVIGGLFD